MAAVLCLTPGIIWTVRRKNLICPNRKGGEAFSIFKNNEMEKTHTEEFKVNGDDLVASIKKLINEGNIRRILIKDEKDNILIEIPLTLGVVGVILLPVWAAIGAIAALVTKCTIVVERRS